MSLGKVGQLSPLGAALRSPLGARTRGGASIIAALTTGAILSISQADGSTNWSVTPVAENPRALHRHSQRGTIVVWYSGGDAVGLDPADGSTRWTISNAATYAADSVSERPDGTLLIFDKEYSIAFDAGTGVYTPSLVRTLANVTASADVCRAVGVETLFGGAGTGVGVTRLNADGTVKVSRSYASGNTYSSTTGQAYIDDEGFYFVHRTDQGVGPYGDSVPQSGFRIYQVAIKLIPDDVPEMLSGSLDDNYVLAVIDEAVYGTQISPAIGTSTDNTLAGYAVRYDDDEAQRNEVAQIRLPGGSFEQIEDDSPLFPDGGSDNRILRYAATSDGVVFGVRRDNTSGFRLVRTASPFDSHEWNVTLAASAGVLLL